MAFTLWLTDWLKRHPLKEPSGESRARYTAEVMSKIKAIPEAAPILPQLSSSRLRWRWAAAFAAVLIGTTAAGLLRRSEQSLSTRVVRESRLLTELSKQLDSDEWWTGKEPFGGLLIIGDFDSLAEELETMDSLTLAQEADENQSWLEETLQLLNQLEEDLPGDLPGEEPEDTWLKELEFLDEEQVSATRS